MNWTHEKLVKLHGRKVTCKIEGEEITDAKISVDDENWVYVCQDEKDGDYVENKFDYRYSWKISVPEGRYENNNHRNCTEIKLVPRQLEDAQPGDVLKRDILRISYYYRVIALIPGGLVFSEGKDNILNLSGLDKLFDTRISVFISKYSQLQKDGWKIYEPEIMELTKDEAIKLLAEKLDKDPSLIKIV